MYNYNKMGRTSFTITKLIFLLLLKIHNKFCEIDIMIE